MCALSTNWDFIEPLYRAGGLSNYEIARQYEITHATATRHKRSVTEGAIRKYAKLHKWSRDLSPAVERRTADKLVRSSVRENDYAEKNEPTDEEIIEAAAETRARVVCLHRRDLQELEALEADIIRRLREDEDQVLVGWYEGEAAEHHVKMGLLDRVRAYRDLVAARSKRILLSRISWGIDDKKRIDETRAVEVHLNLAGGSAEE